MTSIEFKELVKSECIKHGFKKVKNSFYISGEDVLCCVNLQKSLYGSIYYINYYYFIGDFCESKEYPIYYDSDIYERVCVMSKTQTIKGKHFLTGQVEYEHYNEDEMRAILNSEFENKILPPIYNGKKFILNNLNKLYTLTTNKDEVMSKLEN